MADAADSPTGLFRTPILQSTEIMAVSTQATSPVPESGTPGEVVRASATPLRILHITAPAPFGGLESVVRSLCTGHAAVGHQVTLLAVVGPGEEEHPLARSLVQTGADVEVLSIPTRAYARERTHVAALCRRLGPHVVHTHGYRSDVVDAGVARKLGVATVTTVHGFVRGTGKGRLYEWLQRRAHRSFGAVVAVSRQQVPELLRAGVRADRLHVLPNAFGARASLLDRAAARAELGLPADAVVVGWVGRLGREKGADVLVDALAHVSDSRVVASFIGVGAERAALQEQAARLGLSERTYWHGMRPDAATLFPAFDVFALSSRTEGTPIALFEAMHAGVPIIAARVGGVPDVVSEAEALLVDPESPDAIADAIRRILNERDEKVERAQKARARLAGFDINSWLAGYESIYRSLLNSPTAPTRT